MEKWRRDLETWLVPFVKGLRHKTRARMCPAYIAGLIGPGDRKSVQPMAARDATTSYDQLHHFIASGAWETGPLEAALLAEADKMVGGEDAWLIVDDTALPKKGDHSVGVAPQYASSLGKTANCQSLVSVTLASREVPVMVGLRLFLPETWTEDRGRMARARAPKDRQTSLTKPEIAIEEIDRVMAAGLRFGCVLADAGYGSSGPFRQALSRRGLNWAVGLSRRQNVYPFDTGLIFPEAATGRRRKYHVPDRGGFRRKHAGQRKMEENQLAAGHQRQAQLQICCPSRPGRRWPPTSHEGRAGPSHARRRGSLAGRRTARDRGAEILRIKPAGRYEAQDARLCHQGKMGL